MFPIPWNFPFRKKNGDMSTIGAEIGGAGSELPPHSSSDAGKLLGVKPNGSLEWSDTVNSEIQTLTNQVKDMNNILGAKNLLPNQALDDTWNGITWKVNSDGTLSASGTATANSIRSIVEAFEIPVGKYILNGCPSGSGYSTYYLNFSVESGTVTPNGGNDIGEGLAFEVTQTAKITVKARVLSGQTVNIAFKPMIRLASITDDTYEPYVKTNRQLTEDSVDWDGLSEVGAVNLLENTATTQVVNGITFTVNDDGSVTCNGTATATATLFLFGTSNAALENIYKNMKMSGCPSGGDTSTYQLMAQTFSTSTPSSGTDYHDVGEGVILGTANYIRVYIRIANGTTVENLTFKPIITLPSYNGPYVPYAKTNRELTEELEIETGIFTIIPSTSELSVNWLKKYGRVVEASLNLQLSEAVTRWTNLATIPSKFAPGLSDYIQIISTKDLTYSTFNQLQLSSNGYVQSAVDLSSGDRIRFTATWIVG